MELGALVCTPRAPKCHICPVAKYCVALRQGRVSELPRPSRRTHATPRRYVALIAENRGRFLVRQRPGGVINAHLWEFPNLETRRNGGGLMKAARSVLGIKPSSLVPMCTIKHSITRYRITLEVFRVEGRWRRGTTRKGKWLTPGELNRLAFASAHKRILQQLGR